MCYSSQIKLVSYLKAKAILQDIASFEETQEILRTLKKFWETHHQAEIPLLIWNDYNHINPETV